jgi:hypothetical protein
MVSFNSIWVKLFVVLLALFQPIIIILCYGFDVHSISSMWLTALQPLFIITNATTSYFLFNINGWRIPSLFLLLLTAFSIQFSMLFHNIFAIMFFLLCIRSLRVINRLKVYIFPYIGSIIILLLFGIFWAESWAIIVICCYHIHAMYIAHSLHKKGS